MGIQSLGVFSGVRKYGLKDSRFKGCRGPKIDGFMGLRSGIQG